MKLTETPEWCHHGVRKPAAAALDTLCLSLHLLDKTQISETFSNAGLVAVLLELILLVTGIFYICYDA